MKFRKLTAYASAAAISATMLTPIAVQAETTYIAFNANTSVAAEAVYTDHDDIKVAGVFASTLNGLAATIDGKSFTHYIQVRVDAINTENATYTEKAGSTPLIITAKNDGDLTIYYRRQSDDGKYEGAYTANSGKDINLVHKTAAGTYEAVAGVWTMSENVGDPVKDSGYAIGYKTMTLEGGEEYLLYAKGTTGTLLGYSYDAASESTSTPDLEATPTPTPDPNVTPSPTPSPTPEPTATPEPLEGEINVDFTAMTEVPIYSAGAQQGFVSTSSAIMPDGYKREVAPVSSITVSADGAQVTESNGAYLHNKDKNNKNDGDDFNYGGLIYRIDTGVAGAYHLEVETTTTGVRVAPTGMNAGNLTGTNNWDNAREVPRTVSAKWDGNVWSYDFATGEKFIEIEVEPSVLPTADKPQTVGIKSIKVAPIPVGEPGDKPTIHIIGDSTQKTYTFNETISSWGQTLGNYFDRSKVNVINYSMGGRAMKSNYCEGRFDEVLITGKKGDFVFLHSAHNDETISTNRFSRGAGTISNDLTANNANYNKWLDMYVEAVKARGMIPVLVTAMPRINSTSGAYSENELKPNGFNPDSPGSMRAKAASDSSVGLAELYAGAKEYISKLDGKEVGYIYNSIEAGETPAANAANGANGDGTHYREAAAKQFCRIILTSIYNQANAETDTYKDKDIMKTLVSYMPDDVTAAAESGDWSAVFPEMASDVSAVDVVPGAEKQSIDNFYYRTSIEKALQLGLLKKDTDNHFKPTQTITVGEYARGIEKAFGLEENTLTNYTKTYAELTSGESATEKPTNEPTTAPTKEPTEDATQAPAAGVRIEAAYNTDGTLKSVNISNVTQVKEETPAANTKIMYWDSISGMKAVKLYEGKAETMTTAADTYTVTVNQPEGGVVTVYNESAFHTATVDVPAGVTAGQVLGDNEYFKLTAPSEIVTKTDSNGVFADNSAVSTNAIEVRNNGTKQPSYEAKADGILTLYLMFVDTKLITCENKTDTTSAQKYINDTNIAGTTGTNLYSTVNFEVKAGNTYEVYTNGGTGRLFGVKYSSTDYPQSTESLVVNAGDTVRITAVANENYVNKEILVNGKVVSTGKEATAVINADTSVTASFTAEPALVDKTIIASDAALTRQVMGAILYDAYNAVTDEETKKQIDAYMNQNGGVPKPGDPNYDPNIKYEGTPYIPTTGWGALTDKSGLDDALYAKVKAAYNMGLIRPETGIARGSIGVGTELEPTVEVTRAKAAKSLVFCFVLTQPMYYASQKIPAGFEMITPSAIAKPNADAPKTVFTE